MIEIRRGILARWARIGALAMVCVMPAKAQEMRRPAIERVAIDWGATGADFEDYRGVIDTARARGRLRLATQAQIALLKLRFATLRNADLQATVNGLIGERFTSVTTSPTPVLLPFDVPRYLADRLSGNGAGPTASYLNGFSATKYFQPGPSGYDAMFGISAAEASKIPGVTTTQNVTVTMAGSSLFYVLTDPTPPPDEVDPRFPELSSKVLRVIHERALRFTFHRYGAPYLVSIDCQPPGQNLKLLPCEMADKIAVRFLKSLRLAGGAPPKTKTAFAAPDTIDRPKCPDPDFAYHSPGELTPGGGVNGLGGKVDYSVYARLRFPIVTSRAYANSQVFLNGGGCLSDLPRTNNMEPPPNAKGDSYACKQNPAKKLTFFEGAKENYDYPWRDNFCESRDWPLGQCPGNMGHQGQDVRGDKCVTKDASSVMCEPYHHRINAVRNGVLQHDPAYPGLYLIVNNASEHLRFRYLHMNPAFLERDGMVTGREVREGDRLGMMGTYLGSVGGTNYHLHFDVQVPTRDGWLFVSPYMTLVAAYERALGRFGTEIKADGTRAAPTAGVGCR